MVSLPGKTERIHKLSSSLWLGGTPLPRLILMSSNKIIDSINDDFET